MIRPVRLQMRRAAGFDLQAESRAVNGLPAVLCVRPGFFGNRFRIGNRTASEAVDLYRLELAKRSPAFYRHALKTLPGHNLACFCSLDSPACHVDVLLDIFGRINCEAA